MPLVVDGVEIPISIKPDTQSAARAARAIDDINKRHKEQNDLIDKRKSLIKAEADMVQKAEAAKQKAMAATIAAMNQQREKMEKIAQIGVQFAATGGAIFGGMIASAQNFVASASEADQVAQRWKDSTDKITEANMRLGREVANSLNPAYEKLADTLGGIVGDLERNPEMLSGMLRVGAELLAGGTAIVVLANIAKQFATLGAMTGSAGFGKAAGAVGKISELALYATTVVIAAEAGLALGNAVQKALGIGEGQETWKDVAQTFLDIPPAMLTIFQQGMNAILEKIGISAKLNIPVPRIILPGGNNTGQSREEMRMAELRERALEAARRQQEQWDRANAQRREQAMQAQEARAQKMLDAQKNLANQEAAIRQKMADTTRQFIQTEADAHRDYYNRRSDMARQAGIESQRAEQDHQRRIREILRRGNERVMQAAQQRDALGLIRAKREMEQGRQSEEENYRIEARRRNEDFAERIRQMDRDFAIQRQQRLREYEFKMQAYQAEVAAAQQAYQAIIASILQMRHALSRTAATGRVMTGRVGVDYASVSNARPAGSSTANANVNINAGAMNMNQVQKIATQSAMRAAATAMEAAFR